MNMTYFVRLSCQNVNIEFSAMDLMLGIFVFGSYVHTQKKFNVFHPRLWSKRMQVYIAAISATWCHSDTIFNSFAPLHPSTTGAYGKQHRIILIRLPLRRQSIRFPKHQKFDEAPPVEAWNEHNDNDNNGD